MSTPTRIAGIMRLPAELRCRIYREALPVEGQMIKISSFSGPQQPTDISEFFESQHSTNPADTCADITACYLINPLLHTCRETRKEMERFYERRHQSRLGMHVWMNNKDITVFEDESAMLSFYGLRSRRIFGAEYAIAQHIEDHYSVPKFPKHRIYDIGIIALRSMPMAFEPTVQTLTVMGRPKKIYMLPKCDGEMNMKHFPVRRTMYDSWARSDAIEAKYTHYKRPRMPILSDQVMKYIMRAAGPPDVIKPFVNGLSRVSMERIHKAIAAKARDYRNRTKHELKKTYDDYEMRDIRKAARAKYIEFPRNTDDGYEIMGSDVGPIKVEDTNVIIEADPFGAGLEGLWAQSHSPPASADYASLAAGVADSIGDPNPHSDDEISGDHGSNGYVEFDGASNFDLDYEITGDDDFNEEYDFNDDSEINGDSGSSGHLDFMGLPGGSYESEFEYGGL